jgi:hypothetical protein
MRLTTGSFGLGLGVAGSFGLVLSLLLRTPPGFLLGAHLLFSSTA